MPREISNHYDAITLDTSVFEQQGLHLERGLLAQLVQFKNSSVKLALSEVVASELEKHLADHAKTAKDLLDKALRDLKGNHLISPAQEADIGRVAIAIDQPDHAAQKRLTAFLERTGTVIVPLNLAKLDDVMRRYFAPAAPFATAAKKKSEFPDAIALLSLESWAASRGKKLLAISKDEGWAEFAKNSQWIDVESDLALALEGFQKIEDAATFVGSLLRDLGNGKLPEIHKRINDGLAAAVSALDVTAEAYSAFDIEADLVSLRMNSFSFSEIDDGQYDFQIVRIGEDDLTPRAAVMIEANAECHFSLSVWDPIDKESVPMGGTSAETRINFDAGALITISGATVGEPSKIEIIEIELVDAIDSVDFGEISFHHEPDYDE